jgi:hypothetical protein
MLVTFPGFVEHSADRFRVVENGYLNLFTASFENELESRLQDEELISPRGR